MTATETDTIPDEVLAQRQAILGDKAASGGGRAETHPRADYFGSDVTWQHVLPDGVSYIEHRKLNEGALQKYRNATNRDVTINRATKDARIRLAAGDDRASLLAIAVCGWDLAKKGQAVPFSERFVAKTLAELDPEVIDGLLKDIHAKNPALAAEVTAQDIRDEIESLTQQLAEKEAEEAGEASSSR